MKLSANFSLEEMTKTNTGLPNKPTDYVIRNLRLLCKNVLQPAREKLGKPIIVTSGYRSTVVNQRVGGVPTSQHVKGEASDIVCKNREDTKRLFDILKETDFDQLINENNLSWIHVSYNRYENRHQIFSL